MLRISDLGSIPVSVRAMAENKLPMKQSRLRHTLSIWKCGLTWQAALVDGEQLCNHFAPLQKNEDPHFHMAIRGQKLEQDDISQKYPLKGKLAYLPSHNLRTGGCVASSIQSSRAEWNSLEFMRVCLKFCSRQSHQAADFPFFPHVSKSQTN